jgi:Zn-finger nucleic acid-binding protein
MICPTCDVEMIEVTNGYFDDEPVNYIVCPSCGAIPKESDDEDSKE